MKRFISMLPVLAFLVGCAVTPGGSTPVIDDAGITGVVSIGTTAAILGAGSQNAAAEAPAAQLLYDVGSAISTGAKNGTILSLAQLETLVNSYNKTSGGPYDVLIGEVLQLVVSEATKNLPAASTQPSATINPQFQEVLEDIGSGIMAGSLPYAGGTPTSNALLMERRAGTTIIVKHFWWHN